MAAEQTPVSRPAPASPGRAAETGAALVVDRLEHRYGDVEALRGVSFEVPPASIFGLLGPNGSGKTTLFSILSTLLRPQRGTVRVFGHDIRTSAAEVRRALGISFQHPSIDPQLTCRENIRHQGHLYGIAGRTLRERADRLLQRFELADRQGDRAGTLSGGYQRRLELAKALLHQPRLLILDEPATGLDVASRQMLWEDLRSLRSEFGVTILLTTHLMEEAEHCDLLTILNAGQVAATGSPADLKRGIGGEVLRIDSDAPEEVIRELAERHHVEALAVNGSVRIEHPAAHRLVSEIMTALPDRICGVHITPPSLEDVFLQVTGRTFGEADRESGEAQAE